MKTQTINLKFSLARARALSHYLEKDGGTIERELLDHNNEMYDTQVPEVVREFVASQNPEGVRKGSAVNEQKADIILHPVQEKSRHRLKATRRFSMSPALAM